jgi:ferredoxin
MIFQLPSEGPARVIEAAPVDEHADLVKEAETVCPTNAIHVHD